MKKFAVVTVFLAAFISYATYNYFTTNAANVSPATQAVTSSNDTGSSGVTITDSTGSGAAAPPANTSSNTSSAAPGPTAVPPPTPVVAKPTGQYIDGTYTGSVADAYYGNIQVKATISGGKLTNVTFLQYPSDRSTSRYINQQAMPALKAEAIQAQSAQVNGVSGASDTSAAFVQSLGSALAQAKA